MNKNITFASAVVGANFLELSMGWVVFDALPSLLDIVGDGGFYRHDRERHLAHGYDRRTQMRLEGVQRALLFYAQHHEGHLTALASEEAMTTGLTPLVRRPHELCDLAAFPFAPNTALASRTWRQVHHPEGANVFFDAHPPTTANYVYYVTLNGNVGQVNTEDWPLFARLHDVQGTPITPRLVK